MKRKALAIAKWTWLVLVLVFAGIFIYRNWPEIVVTLRQVRPVQVTASVLSLALAKLLLVQASRSSVKGGTRGFSYGAMFYINGVTQVAKYLPGGIWHFVGKFAYYRNAGLESKRATRAIVVENIWLVASAICFGLLFLLPTTLGSAGPAALAGLVGLPQALLLALWWVVFLAVEVAQGWPVGRSLLRAAALVLLLGGCWLLAGLSFVSLFPRPLLDGSLGAGLGAFGLAWAVGYLTLFAPGGLGSRELVLAVLLAPVLPAQQAVTLAGLHRVVWTAVEILFGGVAILGEAAGYVWGVGPLRQEGEADG